jgi:hypothetical protein
MSICSESILQNEAVDFMIQAGLFSPESSIQMCTNDLVVCGCFIKPFIGFLNPIKSLLYSIEE